MSSSGTAGREISQSEPPSPQPNDGALLVSPELALVDPELAQRVRAELPDVQLYEDLLERPVERPVERPPERPVEPRLEPLLPRPRRRRRRGVLVVALATAAAIGAAVLIVENRDGPSQVAPQPSATATGSATEVASTGRAKRRHATKPAPQTVRTFSWVAVRGARSYEFDLFRGAKRIFTSRPLQPRLTLPVAWRYGSRLLRLDQGVYRWLVRPILGSKRRPRFGPTIVSARLVVGG